MSRLTIDEKIDQKEYCAKCENKKRCLYAACREVDGCHLFKETVIIADVVNDPKSKITQLFCRHDTRWFIAQEKFYNLSGEKQYEICIKCGKVIGERFVTNFDE